MRITGVLHNEAGAEMVATCDGLYCTGVDRGAGGRMARLLKTDTGRNVNLEGLGHFERRAASSTGRETGNEQRVCTEDTSSFAFDGDCGALSEEMEIDDTVEFPLSKEA